MKTTEKDQEVMYADTETIITEMLKTVVFHLKKNYDLEFGEGSAERLLNDYGPVMLGNIIPGDGNPTLERLLSVMAKIAVGDEASRKVSGYEVDFVIFPIRRIEQYKSFCENPSNANPGKTAHQFQKDDMLSRSKRHEEEHYCLDADDYTWD